MATRGSIPKATAESALDSDISQLFSCWVRVNSTVTVNRYLVWHQHEENRGYVSSIRLGLDQLECRADRIGGGVNSTGDQTIDVTFSQHHSAKNNGIFQLRFRHWLGQPLALAQLNHRSNVLIADFVHVQNFQTFWQLDTLSLSNSTNGFRLAQKYTVCDTTLLTMAAALMVRASSPSGRTIRLLAACALRIS